MPLNSTIVSSRREKARVFPGQEDAYGVDGIPSYWGMWFMALLSKQGIISAPEAAGYPMTERNAIPSCSRLISAFCIFMSGFGSDLTGSRFSFVFGPLVGCI
ncbi:hypothetical protein DFS33DRAFT_445597 [Desarmillaria ectypa]|nr:hypothetical protein DFS33DRAFT_445597 [Desarmillaria ectypa]